MSCRELREQFSAYLDGELPPEEAQAVSRHVEGCAECARELDDLRRTIEALAEWPVLKAPEGLKAKILAKLEVESGSGKGRAVSRMRSLWPAAAAIIVAVLLAWQGGMFNSRKLAGRTEVASARKQIALDEEMPDLSTARKKGIRSAPTMSAALPEKSDAGKNIIFNTRRTKDKVIRDRDFAFKEEGGQGGPRPTGALALESHILQEKAKKGAALIAGTWSVPSGNPAAARALVAKLLNKRRVKQPRAEKKLRENARVVGRSLAGGETALMEFEVTRAEWAGLVAALKKNGMTLTRKVVAQKVLPSRAVARKREALHALAKQGDADNNDVDGKVVDTVLADKMQVKSKPVAAYSGDAKSAVVEEKEAQQLAIESLAGGEPPQRFSVRLLFPLVSSE